jgi:NSS family neurotransmitter:Na+ symporter
MENIPRADSTKGHVEQTDRWGSRIGVIMAVAGSAVGLGNFLRFPGQAAQYGGGAFMLAYFIALLVIGLPICWAEWSMGRKAGQQGFHSCPGIFHFFIGKAWGKYAGAIGVVVPVVIYMYYVVIEAWCLGYSFHFLTGGMNFSAPDEAKSFFYNFVGINGDGTALGLGVDTVGPFLLFAFILNFFLVYRGLSRGIELFCKYAMPTLIILAVIVLVRVLTLGTPDPAQPLNNVNNGLGFMWNPVKIVIEENSGQGWKKVDELVGGQALVNGAQRVGSSPDSLRIRTIGIQEQLSNPQLWLAAAGQIFFSLSVGFGIILTYASYLRRQDDVVLSGLTATSANEVCEVGLGGLITLPASVAFLGVGTVVGVGTFGLGFNVLPMVFSRMPLGNLFGFLFFFLLFLAAVTSSLSMLQPGIAFLEEALGVGRKISVALLGFITICGTMFVLYFSADLKALDTLDFWVGTFLIFILATLQILIFAWIWGAKSGIAEANQGSVLQLPGMMTFLMKYVSPAFLLSIFALWLTVNVFGYRFDDGEARFSSYIVDLFIEPNPVAWLCVGLILAVFTLVCFLAANGKPYRRTKQFNQS